MNEYLVDGFLTYTIGILVLLVGAKLNARIGFLRNFNIPEPVTGGLIAVVFIIFALFPLMRRDYQAAVLSAGFGGFAFGATPTEVANMTVVTKTHGPAPMAFIILHHIVVFIFFNFLIVSTMNAYQHYEHRDITVCAINNLGTSHRLLLDKLWADARIGYETRLTASVVDPTLGIIDYAAWPAIAGDHSCSSENMLHNILKTKWILDVTRVGAQHQMIQMLY